MVRVRVSLSLDLLGVAKPWSTGVAKPRHAFACVGNRQNRRARERSKRQRGKDGG